MVMSELKEARKTIKVLRDVVVNQDHTIQNFITLRNHKPYGPN
jgi:hypothetical protein